jgi:hypothetical protein
VRWLAWIHPAFMVAILGVGIFVAREGILLRQARLIRRPFDSRRHRRLGRIFVATVVLGYGSGPASLGLLRSEPILDSFHFLLATGALIGLVSAYVVGKILEGRLDSRLRTLHLVCGSLGLLLAIVAGVAGMSILP